MSSHLTKSRYGCVWGRGEGCAPRELITAAHLSLTGLDVYLGKVDFFFPFIMKSVWSELWSPSAKMHHVARWAIGGDSIKTKWQREEAEFIFFHAVSRLPHFMRTKPDISLIWTKSGFYLRSECGLRGRPHTARNRTGTRLLRGDRSCLYMLFCFLHVRSRHFPRARAQLLSACLCNTTLQLGP